MKKYEYTAKTLEDAKAEAMKELNTSEENLIIRVLEEKNTLLKN